MEQLQIGQYLLMERRQIDNQKKLVWLQKVMEQIYQLNYFQISLLTLALPFYLNLVNLIFYFHFHLLLALDSRLNLKKAVLEILVMKMIVEGERHQV